MDPMVSARVPAEVRDRVHSGLKAIGSTPTELINKAYEYFLETKSLPLSIRPLAAGHRRLDPIQNNALRQSLEESTLSIPETYFQGKSYDQLLEESLRDRYEALT